MKNPHLGSCFPLPLTFLTGLALFIAGCSTTGKENKGALGVATPSPDVAEVTIERYILAHPEVIEQSLQAMEFKREAELKERQKVALKMKQDPSSILNADEGTTGNPAVDVIGNNITLTAGPSGSIGSPGDDLDINSAFSGPGTLSSTSGLNTYLIEPSGDLSLNTVQTNAGTAFIAALAGNIVNGKVSGSNVVTGKDYLFASQNIGTAIKPITSAVGNLECQSTAGNTYVTNTGALTVGGVVSSADPGVLAGGSIHITAMSPVTVTEDNIAAAEIIITPVGLLLSRKVSALLCDHFRGAGSAPDAARKYSGRRCCGARYSGRVD